MWINIPSSGSEQWTWKVSVGLKKPKKKKSISVKKNEKKKVWISNFHQLYEPCCIPVWFHACASKLVKTRVKFVDIKVELSTFSFIEFACLSSSPLAWFLTFIGWSDSLLFFSFFLECFPACCRHSITQRACFGGLSQVVQAPSLQTRHYQR